MMTRIESGLGWEEVEGPGLAPWPGTQYEMLTGTPGFVTPERIAALMKADRDANFVETNSDGVTVNRWPTMGFLAGCATSNEPGWLTYKVTRALGMVPVDNQARI